MSSPRPVADIFRCASPKTLQAVDLWSLGVTMSFGKKQGLIAVCFFHSQSRSGPCEGDCKSSEVRHADRHQALPGAPDARCSMMLVSTACTSRSSRLFCSKLPGIFPKPA